MMDDRLSVLRRYLEAAARPPDLLPAAWDLVQPFFRPTAPPAYGLLPASNERRRQLADALSGALERPITRVVAVSISRSHGGRGLPDLVDGDQGLGALLRRRLGDRLWHNLGNKLWECHGRRLWDDLHSDDRSGRELVRLIQDALGANRLDSLLYSLRDVVGDGLVDALFYFLGAAAVGDERLVRQLVPLLRLLPTIAPLGENAGHPETWYALTA